MMNMFVLTVVLVLLVSRVVEGCVSFGERLSHHHSHCERILDGCGFVSKQTWGSFFSPIPSNLVPLFQNKS